MTTTLEELVKNALSEYDFEAYLDDFFQENIDWIHEKFEPVIKESLEKVLKEHGREILKCCMEDFVNERVSTYDIDNAIKEAVIEKVNIKEILGRILK